MKNFILSTFLLLFAIGASAKSPSPVKLKNYTDSLSYATGMIRAMAGSSHTIAVEGVNKQKAKDGYNDFVKNKRTLAMSTFSATRCFELYLKDNEKQQLLDEYQEEVTKFLDENRQKDGIYEDYGMQMKFDMLMGKQLKPYDRVSVFFYIYNQNGDLLEVGTKENIYLKDIAEIIPMYTYEYEKFKRDFFSLYKITEGTECTFFVPVHPLFFKDWPYMLHIYHMSIYPYAE